MEILIIILVVIGGWVLFKIVIPAIQQTKEQMDDIGDAARYVKSDDPIVQDAVTRNRLMHLIEKYQKRGFSAEGAEEMAKRELFGTRGSRKK